MSIDSDLAALRRTAEIYSRGADRRNKDDWRSILADNVVITGPGFTVEGLEANLGSIDHLTNAFKSTRHLIHNQLLQVEGDRATGETVGSADHRMTGPDGSDVLLCWAVRYQDQLVRDASAAAGWRFTRRDLIVDWEEIRPVQNVGGVA